MKKEQAVDKKGLIFLGLFLFGMVIATAFIIIKNQPTQETIIEGTGETQYIRDLEKAFTPSYWQISGDSVFINDDKVFISATPHTGFGWIKYKILPKTYTGDVDIVFGFDTEYIIPTAARINPVQVNVSKSYTCTEEFNYTTNPNYFWCYSYTPPIINETNQTEGRTIIHKEGTFESGDIPGKTAYWTEEETHYTDISGAFESRNFEFENMTKWYFKKNIPVVAGVEREFEINIKPNKFLKEEHKYWFGIKPSGQTIEEAVEKGNFYMLDPWTPDLTTNLISYYKLDESGGAILDAFSSNDGTNVGTTPNVAGIINTAYDFSGTNDYINLNAGVGNDLGNGVTDVSFSLWLKADVTNGNDGVLSIGTTAPGVGANGEIDLQVISNTLNLVLDNGLDSHGVAFTDTISWHNIVGTYDGSNSRFYIDGLSVSNQSYSATLNFTGLDSTLGLYVGTAFTFDGDLDELGIWGKTLTPAQVIQLWNGGAGLPFSVNPSVNITFPLNGTTFQTSISQLNYTVDTAIKCWNTADGGATNSSPVTPPTNFTISPVPNWNNYTVYCNNSLGAMGSDDVNFFVNKTVGTILNSPQNNFKTFLTDVQFSYNSTSLNSNLTNTTFNIWFNNGTLKQTNFTSLSGTNETNTQINSSNFIDGNYLWGAETCGLGVPCSVANNRSFEVHTVTPTVNLTYPIGLFGSLVDGVNITLNWTVEEAGVSNLTDHLKNCSYFYNGTATALTPEQCVLNSTTLLYATGKNSISFTATDDFNLSSNSTTSWVVVLSEISQTFNNVTVEGSQETFDIRILVDPSFKLLTATLIHNGTIYAGALVNEGSNIYNASRTITIQNVVSQELVNFKWSFIMNESTVVNSLTKNQTINNISIGSCGEFSNTLYNFSIVDEDTQILIPNVNTTNTSSKLNMQIFDFGGIIELASYNASFVKINPFGICTNNNLSDGGELKIFSEIEYVAEGYATEFYNIQNTTINSESFPTLINLMDLNSSRNQNFKIIYKDGSFSPVANALINIQRKFIAENEFKTVEIPKTDSFGETIGHFVTNSVIYKFIVVKNGVILGTFPDSRVVCQNPSLDECVINLNSFEGNVPFTDFEEERDLSYTISHNRATRTVSVVYSVPSASVSTFVLNVTKEDALRVFACSDSITSSTGVLTCNLPASIGNSTVLATLYKDGVEVGKGTVIQNPTPGETYGVVLVLLGLFSMLTLIGAGMSDNPVFTIIFLLIGVILLYSINLVANNGFIGSTATILWLILAIIIIIVRGRSK